MSGEGEELGLSSMKTLGLGVEGGLGADGL